ncbi:hypothetical protein Q3H58_000174 [Pseudomonas psychrotolerans]|nr:hypothetical protein [Pseudomonas psychrotolerans]
MGANGPRFVQRVEFQINVPTGEYDRDKDINPGNHAWSLDPYWAATYWFTPKWTVSVRAHYLYNFKNDKPSYAFGDVSDIQAGQALHANFATEYAVTPQLRLGINGYWLKQITDTQVDGHDVSGRREKVWAIGPGAMYSFSKNDHLVANAYFEQDAENRPEGSSGAGALHPSLLTGRSSAPFVLFKPAGMAGFFLSARGGRRHCHARPQAKSWSLARLEQALEFPCRVALIQWRVYHQLHAGLITELQAGVFERHAAHRWMSNALVAVERS